MDYKKTGETFTVIKVQISDLEDAVILSPGKYVRDGLCGNQLWRSPESWARAAQGTPSDIFSFGVVVGITRHSIRRPYSKLTDIIQSIYVMLNDMVLRASRDELAAIDSRRHVLRRQISFFGEEDGFQGLLQWIGEENLFFERLITLAGSFNAANPRKPFEKWHFVDAGFRDLVGKMTILDPARRITAAQALDHPWFAGSDD